MAPNITAASNQKQASDEIGATTKLRTYETRAAAATAIGEIRHLSSRLRRREFASASSFASPVLREFHQPPSPFAPFVAPAPN